MLGEPGSRTPPPPAIPAAAAAAAVHERERERKRGREGERARERAGEHAEEEEEEVDEDEEGRGAVRKEGGGEEGKDVPVQLLPVLSRERPPPPPREINKAHSIRMQVRVKKARILETFCLGLVGSVWREMHSV